MKRNKFIVAVLMLLIHGQLLAQDRFMVFFTDKDNNNFSIGQPDGFLSQRALDRRARNSVVISETDLPVSQEYVDQLINNNVDVFFTSRWMNGALVQMEAKDTAAISALNFVSSVEFVAPGVQLSRIQEPFIVPETFLEPSRVTADTEIQLAMIGADAMHADGYTGDGVLIAVFDDGFIGVNEYAPFEHVFANNQLVMTRDFVGNSGDVFRYDDHGSAAFSCIAATYGSNISGTAPDADYILCVTEDYFSEYRIEEYNWLLAAELADSAGVDIISSSLGYSTFSRGYEYMNYAYEQMDGETTVIARAASMASERGIAVVVSAGNSGSSSWKYITSPADAEEVLAVGSVNVLGDKSGFSSFGPNSSGRIKPDIMALGLSTTIFQYPGAGEISTGSGTSFAAPQIAGLAAGLLQANPTWTSEKLVNAIRYTGSRALNPDNEMGYGLANYADAVQGVVLSASDILSERFTVYPNPFTDNKVFISFGDLKFRHDLQVSVFDAQGRQLFIDSFNSKQLPEELEINLSTIEKGIYYLILKSKRFEKQVKLIKL